MRSFLRLLLSMSGVEKTLLLVLTLSLVVSGGLLLRKFYVNATDVLPAQGGTYIEGSIGELHPLNPWFTITNDVNRDIVSLIFGGLLRYDPTTKKIVDDLATMSVSDDGRIYTLTLKEDIHWHDWTEKDPHVVTADDVLYTYRTIQDPDFPNQILSENFRGVTIEKVDKRTVQFRLKNPYAFFSSNLTIGILPARAFEGIPVASLDQTIDFGYQPIGAGPYKLVSLIETDISTEVTLKRFDRPGFRTYNFESVVFRIFPTYSALLSDLSNLDGVRQVPRNADGEPILPHGFHAIPYTLPQYVALFFNLDRPILKENALRLGLQLATNKQEIIDAIHETTIVDTPLLEIDLGDWRYQFDPQAAQGALFESEWNVPEKVRLQRLLEERDANANGKLQFPDTIVLLSTGASLTLTGSVSVVQLPVFVNGVVASTGGIAGSNSGTWAVRLGTNTSMSGALHIGTNIVRLTDAKGNVLDTAYIDRYADSARFAKARSEQELVEAFVASREESLPASKRITTRDLFLDDGFLRKRTADDQPHTRVNARGEPLTLTLLTSNSPETYPIVADLIAKQWAQIGVTVNVVIPDSRRVFEERMLKRDYDIVLFGESLLDNLDSYPYWHSGQIQDRSGEAKNLKVDALNLSQYTSIEADALLTKIRQTRDPALRDRALTQLNALLKKDVPAIFLYSPLSIFGYRDRIGGIAVANLSLHSDRFQTMEQWYVHTRREFKDGKSWWSFVPWLFSGL